MVGMLWVLSCTRCFHVCLDSCTRKLIHPPPPPTGTGIFVSTGESDDGNIPTGVLPNNGIVIALDNQWRLVFHGSVVLGQQWQVLVSLWIWMGTPSTLEMKSGVFNVDNTGGGSGQPGSVQFRNRDTDPDALTSDTAGVYSCRIPDETGSDVDVNIGVYQEWIQKYE